MKSWKTTLIGALLGGGAFLSIYQTNGGDLAHWQQWVIPFLLAVLGVVAKDTNVTNVTGGTVDTLTHPPPQGGTTNESPTKRMLIGLLFVGLVSFAVMTASCTGPQWQAAQARLQEAGMRVVEATGKAAATAALAEAELELTKLETAPLRDGATSIELAGRAAAIEQGRRLVADLRKKVFSWSFTSAKQPIVINP